MISSLSSSPLDRFHVNRLELRVVLLLVCVVVSCLSITMYTSMIAYTPLNYARVECLLGTLSKLLRPLTLSFFLEVVTVDVDA